MTPTYTERESRKLVISIALPKTPYLMTRKILYYKNKTPNGWQNGRAVTISTQLILETAKNLGIDWQEIPGTGIFRLIYKKRVEYFYIQIPSKTTALAHFICADKRVTRNMLLDQKISVPKGFTITRKDSQSYRQAVYKNLPKPLVVKPTDGSGGHAVTLKVTNQKTYNQAINQALEANRRRKAGVVVEEHFAGKEYRILASKNKVIGITHRIPANVVGDGESTIKNLIKNKNSDPNRGKPGFIGTPLVKIQVDKQLKQHLQDQNLNLNSIPKAGQRVWLRSVSNISQGGDSIDYTDQAHPSIHKLALQVMKAIPGLALAGIDLMTTNIDAPQDKDSYRVIEVNDSPGITMHDLPLIGRNRQAGLAFLEIMFPELV